MNDTNDDNDNNEHNGEVRKHLTQIIKHNQWL